MNTAQSDRPWIREAKAYCQDHNHSYTDFYKNGELVCPMCIEDASEKCGCCPGKMINKYWNEHEERYECRNCYEETLNGGHSL